MQIGIRLSKIREVYHLSQKELADKVGIPQPNYSRYELNKSEPPCSFLAKYVVEFKDIEPVWLLNGYLHRSRAEILKTAFADSDMKKFMDEFNVSEELINSFMNNEIVPSFLFINQVLSFYNFAPPRIDEVFDDDEDFLVTFQIKTEDGEKQLRRTRRDSWENLGKIEAENEFLKKELDWYHTKVESLLNRLKL